MRVITREFYNVKRADVFRIIPIGDVHIGAATCDEKLLKNVVDRIAKDPDCYWIGLGDYAEFINRNDKRFDPETLAGWLEMSDLTDLSKAQQKRFLSYVKPIAHKCLALCEGNHERTIKARFERDIFSNIVMAIKDEAGIDSNKRIGIGIYGWLLLRFYRQKRREAGRTISINIHHGFVGGRLAGAKALNMQRWLWSHECDVALFGHSHNTMTQNEMVEGVDRMGRIVERVRRGAYTGTFNRTVNPDGPASYAEERGYFPLPIGGVEIVLRPHTKVKSEQVRILS